MLKIITVIFIYLYSSSAFAYLDPGTGSIILQSAIAAIVGGYYAARLYWANIKLWFKRHFNKETATPEMEAEVESNEKSGDTH